MSYFQSVGPPVRGQREVVVKEGEKVSRKKFQTGVGMMPSGSASEPDKVMRFSFYFS